jgi:predicted ATP-dependent endonuclease of OLD family
MRIAFIEIANFRKLKAVRVDFTETTTLFVGANNSGKTSAMVALRSFLTDRGYFTTHDFTVAHWKLINAIGTKWQTPPPAGEQPVLPTIDEWKDILPFLDLWLEVAGKEIHYVRKLLPTLDWAGGKLGVRLRLEPEDIVKLREEFLTAVEEVKATKGDKETKVKLWPENLLDFLHKRLRTHFTVRAYVLDPAKCKTPENGRAVPQDLIEGIVPIEEDPLKGLIRVDEITAQRGFADRQGKTADGAEVQAAARRDSRKLSDQLRSYYQEHLDPFKRPEASDLDALEAIANAETAFDARLKTSFRDAFEEVQDLGYPGVTDPKLEVSTRLRPVEGLNHDSAVRYEITNVATEKDSTQLLLPEDYNGLGYQNLISIVFRLMGFRDAWMRVGKAKHSKTGKDDSEDVLEPLHLVLIEEPEAHLHAQVQQVFIRKAYDILRRHKQLGDSDSHVTQMIVSTHSSHVAHETHFKCLRYFRRLPAGMAGDIPISTVINLSEVFGSEDETQRFVRRYLRTTHCDLFFADAAILVEGPAERILVPHFIHTHFKKLHQCYITLLEIGGSHAHRLESLINHLGIVTLVITDLDAAEGKKAALPSRKKNQVTSNATLKSWLPKLEKIDDLLNLADDKKMKQADSLFAIRVAYQTPVKIGEPAIEYLPSTFEDALVFANHELFKTLEGDGLIAEFKAAVNGDQKQMAQALFDSLRVGKKAEFALDILQIKDTETLAVPDYIKTGLIWLDEQMKVRHRAALTASAPAKGEPIIVEAAAAPPPPADAPIPAPAQPAAPPA